MTETVDKLIDNEELKLILNANVQYYNDTPDTLSFLLHSVAQYSYYQGGGFYIVTPHGTAYGYKPTPKQFFKIPKIKSDKINNLYFVGQWVVAGGFSPAISSAWLCYDSIMNKK